MEPQAKKKTFWSTFKNAYLRSKNLKNFWNNLDKKNLSNELQETFEHYLNSESYNWSSKFWRHLTMNHLNLMANSNEKNYKNIISQDGINDCFWRNSWNYNWNFYFYIF